MLFSLLNDIPIDDGSLASDGGFADLAAQGAVVPDLSLEKLYEQ
jgi:hypothetical protein